MSFLDFFRTPFTRRPVEGFALIDEPVKSADNLQHRNIGIVTMSKDNIHC